MKLSSELHDWIERGERAWDPDGRADAEALAFERMPPVQAFRKAVRAAGPNTRAIVDAIEALFVETEWATGPVLSLARGLRDNPFQPTPFRAISGAFHDALLLIGQNEAAVALSIIAPDRLAARKRESAGKGSVNFAGRASVLRFIQAGGLELSIWEAAPLPGEDEGPRAQTCHKVETRIMADGEMLRLDTRRQSFIFERAEAPVIFLHGEARVGGEPVSREFDAVTGLLVATSSGHDEHSRTQLLASYLRDRSRRDAGPLLAKIIDQSPYFVRWHAMREWLALDTAAALPALKHMAACDPHREIRAAAAQTLAVIGDQIHRKAA